MTVEYAAPPPAPAQDRSRDLGWISVVFIACWGVPVFLHGLLKVTESLIDLHDFADPAAPAHFWPNPFPMWLDETLFLVGLLALNLLLAGVVMGVIAILRARPRAYLRAAGFLGLVGVGVVGSFWADSLEFDPTGPMGGVGGNLREFVSTGGLGGALIAMICVATTFGSAYLVLGRPVPKVSVSQR